MSYGRKPKADPLAELEAARELHDRPAVSAPKSAGRRAFQVEGRTWSASSTTSPARTGRNSARTARRSLRPAPPSYVLRSARRPIRAAGRRSSRGRTACSASLDDFAALARPSLALELGDRHDYDGGLAAPDRVGGLAGSDARGDGRGEGECRFGHQRPISPGRFDGGRTVRGGRIPALQRGLTRYTPGRIRTFGLCLRRAALYPLSYGRLEGSV